MAERDAILAVTPPDPAAHIRAAELAAGEGRYRAHPVAHALWALRQAEMHIARIERDLARAGRPRADRRRWRAELASWQPRLAVAAHAAAEVGAPEMARIDDEERNLDNYLSGLWHSVTLTSSGRVPTTRPRSASITSPARSTR